MIDDTTPASLIDVLRRPVIKTALLLLAIGFFTFASIRVVRHQMKNPADGDWGVYYRTGLAMRHRQPIYTLDHGPMLTFKNAPIVAAMLMPVSLFPVGLARWLWLVADLASVAAMYRLASRVIFGKTFPTAAPVLIAGAVFLSAHFIFDELFSGPTAAIVLAITTAGFVWAYEGKGWRAGFALAVAICLKLVPLAFVPWLLCCKSRWTSAASLVVSLILLNLLPAAWVGWERNERLLREWPVHIANTQIPMQEYREQNQSANAAILRFLTPTPFHVNFASLDPRTAKRIGLLVMAFAAFVIYGAIVLERLRGQDDPGAALALLLLYMTIFNPLAWRYNYIAVGIAYLYVLHALLRNVKRSALVAGLLGVSWLFHFLPKVMQEFSARFFGTVALGVAVWLCWHDRKNVAESTTAAHNTDPVPAPSPEVSQYTPASDIAVNPG